MDPDEKVISCPSEVLSLVGTSDMYTICLLNPPKKFTLNNTVYKDMPLNEKIEYICLMLLRLPGVNITFDKLMFGSCGLQKKQIPYIQEFVSRFSTIRFIDISDNQLIDSFGAELLPPILALPGLEELHLKSNKFDDQTYNVMCVDMPPTLKVLTLQDNKFDFITRRLLDRVPKLVHLGADRVNDVSGLMYLEKLYVGVYTEECIQSTWALPLLKELEGDVTPELKKMFDRGRSMMVNSLLVFLQTDMALDTIKYLLTF